MDSLTEIKLPPFKNDKCTSKSPRQIYSKASKVLVKLVNSKKTVIKFYNYLFKDLKNMDSML